jgi:hypothetical protein
MPSYKLSNEEYQKLKFFLGFYHDLYWSTCNPESHPLIVAAEIEKKSMSNAKKGLQMAINDIIENTSDWPPAAIAEADAKFAQAGTYTLSELRARYSRKYSSILKRGVIRSEVEYYFLKGIYDGGSIEVGAAEAEQIAAMLCAYENKVAGIS